MSINASSSAVIQPNEGILRTAQTQVGKRTPDDIIRNAQPITKKQERMLLDVSQLLHDQPELFGHLAELVFSRLRNNRAASVREALERSRWNYRIHMTNDIAPLLARILVYVHPGLLGMVRLNPVPLDEVLGMRVAQKKLPGDYARRLEWCDGRPLTGPPPLAKKTVQTVSALPAQGELFGEVA